MFQFLNFPDALGKSFPQNAIPAEKRELHFLALRCYQVD